MGYKPDWFRGIYPALVTPFDRRDRFDEAAYRELIRFVLPHVDGVLAAGTTGEFSYLDAEERKRVIEVAVDEVAGHVPVLAGTGAPSTRETLELTAFARDVGATAALVVAPYYLKPSFNEVYDHYRALDALGFPLVLYNIPQCAGTHYRWWTAEGMLLDLENVIGIKDSSGDMPFIESLVEKVYGQVALFVGCDEIVTAALAAGCDGAILASANLVPDVWQRIYHAVQRGDLETARYFQIRLQKLIRIIVNQGSTQAVKEGLQMMGLRVGNSRHPIMPGGAFRREDREELRLQLELPEVGKIPRRPVVYDLGGREVHTEVPAIHQTPSRISGWAMKVGEGFAGPPFQEIAHVDLLIGLRDGPVGRAIERALQEHGPQRGCVLLESVVADMRSKSPREQGCTLVEVRPRTLLVPTVTIRTERQRHLFYERAAAGVQMAIQASIEDGFLPEAILDDIAMIANVFVHPAASIGKRVELNNYKAMRQAIRKAIEGRPTYEELLSERAAARHPFRYAP